jgi:cytochrome c5
MTPLILAAALTLVAANDASHTAAAPPTMPAASAGQQAAAAQTAPAAKPKDDPDKVVCRDEEVTGSRFTRRVCMTKNDWDTREKQSHELMNALDQQSGRAGSSGGAPP